MNLWLAGGSVAAIGIAFGLDHVAWRFADEKRRRRAGRRGGTVDLRVRF